MKSSFPGMSSRKGLATCVPPKIHMLKHYVLSVPDYQQGNILRNVLLDDLVVLPTS